MAEDRLKAAKVAEQLAQLRNVYLSRLPAELGALKKLADALSGGEHERPSLEELHHRLHKLAGSGGTFGLPALSASAGSLESRINLKTVVQATEVTERDVVSSYFIVTAQR